MQFHLLFRMVKTAGLHLIPIISYSKNGHPFFISERVLVNNVMRGPFIRLSRMYSPIQMPRNKTIHMLDKERISAMK